MIYLSHYLSNDTPTYANSKDDIKITPKSCMDHGDASNSLFVQFKNHIGTHIDLPRHFSSQGKVLNDYPASFWKLQHVQLLELPCSNGHIIQVSELENKIDPKSDCLIIKTGFEKFRAERAYWEENPGFAKETGTFLRKNFPNLKIIGFDFISLTSFTNRPLGREAHKSFLDKFENYEPILIMEDMKLGELKSSPKELIIAPLLIDSADGGPVTVFAFL